MTSSFRRDLILLKILTPQVQANFAVLSSDLVL